MSDNSNRLSHFWQELKRRRVIHVIIVYATAAFVLIELVGNIYETLNLPDWTPALTLLILVIGFPLAIIFSWIFDVTPEGIEKTKPSRELLKSDETATPNFWRIATYVSGLIILSLLALNIFGGKKRVRVDESLEKSIAVIPFLNFSADADQEFMCLGLTDEIINHLFEIESFDKVISLSSVMTYIGSDKKIPDIADELAVNYILEGTYKKIGDQIRVTAQLIEAGSDKHLWQHEYDCPYEEIIAIQADIALQIADHIRVFISAPEIQRIHKVPTTNQEAYELMQQASYLFITESYGKRKEIQALAQKAIELDPEYAEAYALIGSMIFSEGFYFGEKELQTTAWEAMPYLMKALEMDNKNRGAITGMALISFFVQWEYVKAEEYFSEIKNYILSEFSSFYAYITFIIEMGRGRKVLELMEKSEYQFDGIAARAHILLDHPKEAYELIAEGNHKYQGIFETGELYIWLEEYDSARYYLEAAMQLDSTSSLAQCPRYQTDLALAYQKTGAPEQARTIMNQLIRKSDTTAVGSPAFFTGWYFSAIGEIDSAFYWLEKAYQNRSPEMPWLKADPAFKTLRDDPRYWDLYERTGHKAYDEYMASKQQ